MSAIKLSKAARARIVGELRKYVVEINAKIETEKNFDAVLQRGNWVFGAADFALSIDAIEWDEYRRIRGESDAAIEAWRVARYAPKAAA